jgi:hypothetical protein
MGWRPGCGWADIFPIIEARVKSDVCPMFFSLGTEDTLAQALGAAGFNLVAERISTTLACASAEEAADAAFAGGLVPMASAYLRRGVNLALGVVSASRSPSANWIPPTISFTRSGIM